MLDFSGYAPLFGVDDLPDDLAGVDAGAVAAVADAIRGWCGWHIAPRAEDDVLVIDSNGGALLFLPTLAMDEPSSVVDADGVDIEGWSWSAIGNLELCHGRWWPQGFRAVTVTVSHGFASAPPAVLAVAAHMLRERADEVAAAGPALKTAQLDGAMLAYETNKATGLLRVLDDYAYAIGRYRL